MAERLEYRVSWRREGQQTKRKLYQTHQGAENWIKHVLLADPPTELVDRGHVYERMIAPFAEGPTLESRPVGIWSPNPQPEE